eukprot:15361054-Ditylum_brightwellii.AAC.2
MHTTTILLDEEIEIVMLENEGPTNAILVQIGAAFQTGNVKNVTKGTNCPLLPSKQWHYMQ